MANLNISSLPILSNSTTPPSAYSLPLSHQIGIAILVIAFIFGFPGNLFVVWTVLCRVQKRSVTCLLVLNLALADALVLLSAPFFLRLLAGRKGWEFGGGMCKTIHYLCCVNMYVSIYLICLMSLDRWLAVVRPFLSQRLRNKRTLYIVMLGIWIMAFVMALPMPFYRSNLQPFLSKNISIYICMHYHWESANHEIFQYVSETLLGFAIPFTFIIFCYSSVVCRLRSAMFHGRVKGSLLILLIITAFALFWLPYHIINILQVIGLLQNRTGLAYTAAKTARPNVTAFAFMSSSVNPVLYVFAGSSHIRRAGLGFMAKMFEGTYSETSAGSGRRSTIHTSSSGLTKMSFKSIRSGSIPRNKSFAEEGKRAETMEEMKTLTTMP